MKSKTPKMLINLPNRLIGRINDSNDPLSSVDNSNSTGSPKSDLRIDTSPQSPSFIDRALSSAKSFVKETFTFESQGNNTDGTVDDTKVKADAANETKDLKSFDESRPKNEKSKGNETHKLTEKSAADDHAKSDIQTKPVDATESSRLSHQDSETGGGAKEITVDVNEEEQTQKSQGKINPQPQESERLVYSSGPGGVEEAVDAVTLYGL